MAFTTINMTSRCTFPVHGADRRTLTKGLHIFVICTEAKAAQTGSCCDRHPEQAAMMLPRPAAKQTKCGQRGTQ